ncbi:MAG: hypothetical protein ACREFN_00900, partial [Acetobacteraceae bacterium]
QQDKHDVERAACGRQDSIGDSRDRTSDAGRIGLVDILKDVAVSERHGEYTGWLLRWAIRIGCSKLTNGSTILFDGFIGASFGSLLRSLVMLFEPVLTGWSGLSLAVYDGGIPEEFCMYDDHTDAGCSERDENAKDHSS